MGWWPAAATPSRDERRAPARASPRGGGADRGLQRFRPAPAPIAQRHLKRAQLRLGRRRRLRLDRAVVRDQFQAERGERGAAAPRAARLRGCDRLAKAAVHVVEQQPGATVRHAERAAGLRDRAGPADGFEQPDLAGTERTIGAKIDTHRQPSRVHRSPCAGRSGRNFSINAAARRKPSITASLPPAAMD